MNLAVACNISIFQISKQEIILKVKGGPPSWMRFISKETLYLKNVSLVSPIRLISSVLDLKDHILKEADRLFCRHGIKSITMDDVAAGLGMSKKTIYQYFNDKNELVSTLISQKVRENIRLLDQSAIRAENPIDEIFRAVQLVKELFLNINSTFFYDLQKYHPEAWKIFQQFRNEYLFQRIGKNLEDGIACGYYRDNIDVDILTRLRIEQIDLVFNPEAFPPATYHLTQVMESVTEHFVYGIATVKGHQQISQYLINLKLQDEN